MIESHDSETLQKIDAHFHLWRYDARDYDWITEEMGVLRQDYLPARLAEEFRAAGIAGGVVVQAQQTVAETDWLISLKRESSVINGVVGWVDLRSSRVTEELDRLAPDLVGVRHVLQAEPDDAFMLREDFVRGLSELARYGLAYDLLLFPRHLQHAEELVRRLPEQRFVLDHLAKPFIQRRQIEPWASDLRRLARAPNVVCKLSGLVTEADWRAWKPSDLVPYLETALEAFGPGRLMFGSDFPVCLVAASYAEVLAVIEELVARLSQDERRAVLGENARRFYRLDDRSVTGR